MTADEICRAVSRLDLDARRTLVARIGDELESVELESVERVLLGAERVGFVLRAALAKREERIR